MKLIQATRLLPQQSTRVTVRADEGLEKTGTWLLEADQPAGARFCTEPTLVSPNQETSVMLTNVTGFTQHLEEGTSVGVATRADVLVEDLDELEQATSIQQVTVDPEREEWRRERVGELFGKDVTPLEEEEQAKFLRFLKDSHEVFALEEDERGGTDRVQLHIDTGDAPPKKQNPRRLPFSVRKEVSEHLRRMEKAGVIRPSNSPWASPIVLVRKKDGTHRFCVDYRGLNEVTKADTFPLPRITDLLDQLAGTKYFSTLDLASGYWQIEIDSDSQPKTAFATHCGLHEFKVMPFGLKNAPAVFQRLMQQVLADLNLPDQPEFVSVYIDDLLVFSRTLEEHIQHLKMVIARLLDYKLKLKSVKCKFIRQEVTYLGHTITPQGLKTGEENIRAVKEFPVPCDVHEVRRFLGLASYYRRFVPCFAKIAHPLHALTRKDAVFDWNSDCQSAFEELKERLTKAPVLAYPQLDKAFQLEMDASGLGVGAVLSQVQEDGKNHPIAYASRALSPCERNYGITELETLVVVWSTSHFRDYLYGQDVTIYTDHTAVAAVLHKPNASGKHARWWLKVHGSGIRNVTIRYRPGKENSNADALSRSPIGAVPSDETTALPMAVAQITAEDLSSLFLQEPTEELADDPLDTSLLEQEQKKDHKICQMMEYLKSGVLPVDAVKSQAVVAQSSKFALLDGVLYFVDPKNSKERVVVPSHLKEDVILSVHGGPFFGHFSGNRVFKILARSWWWEGMFTDCHNHCKGCPQCCIVRGGEKPSKPPLQPIPVSRPFQILGIDIMDLPLTEKGNRHVLVIQDFLTKWPWVFSIPDQKTIRLVDTLVREIIPECGVPECLLSDRGTNLLSHLMRDVCSQLGITKLNTTAYHPQCDGLTERFNRTLKTMVRKHVDVYGKQWDKYLHGLLWAYRNTPHEATGEKPSFLLYGRDCRYPIEAAFLPSTEVEMADLADYRQELALTLTRARDHATQSIQVAQKQYKKYYDKVNKCSPVKIKVGDSVLIQFPQEESGKQRKLSRPWHGPYRVVEVTPTGIAAQREYTAKDDIIRVHLNRVTRCPLSFPAGYYWYGDRRCGPGRSPKVVADSTGDQIEAEELDVTPEELDVTPLSVVKAGYSCSCAGDLVHPYKLCTSTMNNLNMYIYMGLHGLQVELWGSRT